VVQNNIESHYEDVIIYEPELLMVTLNKEQRALLDNPRYLNLVKIIHEKGPLTVAEMAEEYAGIAKDDQAKSESTVYRYLNALKNNDIVQESGQRITEGKSHTTLLYSLTSNYLVLDEPEIDWESNCGLWIFKEIVKILGILYPSKPINEKALFQWQLEFQKIVDRDKQKLINSRKTEILEIMSVWSPYSINDIMEYVQWNSVLLKDPEVQQKLLNCFNESVELEIVSSSKNKSVIQKKKKPYRDIIRQFPEVVLILPENDPRCRYFTKPAYLPLFHILRDKPMTIEEIVDSYGQVTSIPRKKSTIYRYIKKLKEANLVIEAGQRVEKGKRTVQRLYTATGRVIDHLGKYEPGWDSEKRMWLLDSVITILNFLYPELGGVNKEAYRKFRSDASYHEREGSEKFLSNPEISKMLQGYNWRDLYIIYTSFWDYYYFMNMSDLHERIKECFSE
jgi:predicted transcriptional regulator